MASTTPRRLFALIGALGLALSAAACSGETPSSSDNLSKPECAAFKDYSGISGKKVSIYASIRDTEADLLKQSWKEFEDCTGVQISYEGTGEFETQIKVRVDGGRAPDIAFIPQPGLIETFVKSGKLKAASDKTKTTATENYSADWLKYSTFDGKFYGAPLGSNVKSFVWYSPKMFADKGWPVIDVTRRSIEESALAIAQLHSERLEATP